MKTTESTAPRDGVAPATGHRAASRRGTATAVMLVVIVGVLMQSGSAVAVLVIRSVGVVQAVWLRTVFAAILLVAFRPRSLRLPHSSDRLLVAGLAAALMAMNFSFYMAISHAPVESSLR